MRPPCLLCDDWVDRVGSGMDFIVDWVGFVGGIVLILLGLPFIIIAWCIGYLRDK